VSALPPAGPNAPLFYWVDHTSAFPSNTGVQRVTRSLARALQDMGRKIEFVCWDAKKRVLRPLTVEERAALSLFHGPAAAPPAPGGAPEGLTGRWLIMPEVPHVTYHAESPLEDLLAFAAGMSMRTAWIFYDAIPHTTPGYEGMRPAHEAYMKALSGVDRIFPISKSAGEDLAAFWRRAGIRGGEHRVSPVPLPGEFPGARRCSGEEPPAPPLRFLCVGSVERRKNHVKLLAAFNRFSREYPQADVRLTIAGNAGGDFYPILRQAVSENPRIEYLGFVPDEKLRDLYAGAHATIFPSVAEGFGLPIIESLWHGRPCLCADFGAMGEVAEGGGCLAVDTYFAAEIFEGIRKLVLEPGVRRQLAREAAARPFRSWKDYGAEILHGMETRHESLSVG